MSLQWFGERDLMPLDLPPWVVMWLFAGALFVGCKWLTWRQYRPGVSWARGLAYCLAWPGMDADAFLTAKPDDVWRPTPGEWILAGGNLLVGMALFWGVAPLLADPLARGWLGMIGLALLLHFGVFHLLSCFWRSLGVLAAPIMNWPALAQSVSEFWGRRWNLAFRDLTHRFLFRPLQPWVGPRWALALGFLVSGLVHELVISVPAGAGYGGPTAFFCLQAGGILLERSRLGRRFGFGRGWRGRLFAFAMVLLPAFFLFHQPFVHAIVVPMMDAVGAGGD